MKRYKLILFFNIFILLTASAQKIENLVELKQPFMRLQKSYRDVKSPPVSRSRITAWIKPHAHLPLHPKVIGYGAAQ